MLNSRHALCALCLSLFIVSCNTQQPTVKPALMAHLHQTLTDHSEMVWEVAFSPDGRQLASSGEDKTVKLWRMPDGILVSTLTGGSEHVYAVAFSPDGKWLASGSREKGNVGTLWKHLVG